MITTTSNIEQIIELFVSDKIDNPLSNIHHYDRITPNGTFIPKILNKIETNLFIRWIDKNLILKIDGKLNKLDNYKDLLYDKIHIIDLRCLILFNHLNMNIIGRIIKRYVPISKISEFKQHLYDIFFSYSEKCPFQYYDELLKFLKN